jgi:hypothetical protein
VLVVCRARKLGQALAGVTLRGAKDMPDGHWHAGPMKSYVGLWSADCQYINWTGTWAGNDPPQKGHI